MRRKPVGHQVRQRIAIEIALSGKSVREISIACGISHSIVSRFVSEKRDIRVGTAEKLLDYFGLQLIAAKRK